MLKVMFNTAIFLDSKLNESTYFCEFFTLENVGTLNLSIKFERAKFKETHMFDSSLKG